MEIWIIGGAIVALMIYASTKIKKSAARAFEREVVETEEFSVIKPEGFLHVVSPESDVLFYAYSKDFGTDEAGEMRQAEIFIRAFEGKTLAEVCQGIKAEAEKIVYEEVSETKDVCLLETEQIKTEKEISETFRIVKSAGKVYEVKISVLKDFADEYAQHIETVNDSFRVK